MVKIPVSLGSAQCVHCAARVVLEGEPRAVTMEDFAGLQNVLVADAHCQDCDARYLAWCRPSASDRSRFDIYDLSYRSTSSAQAGPDDGPKYHVVLYKEGSARSSDNLPVRDNRILRYRQVVLEADKPTGSGTVYPRAVLEAAIARFVETMLVPAKSGKYGPLSTAGDLRLRDVGFVVRSVELLASNEVVVEIELLRGTDAGKVVTVELVEKMVQLCPVGYGIVKDSVVTEYELLGFHVCSVTDALSGRPGILVELIPIGSDRTCDEVCFISGPKDLTPQEYYEYYEQPVREAFKRGAAFVVGDESDYCDRAAQWQLRALGANRVTVYHVDHVQQPPWSGFAYLGGFASIQERDAAMTDASTCDIAWVRPGHEDRDERVVWNLHRRAGKQISEMSTQPRSEAPTLPPVAISSFSVPIPPPADTAETKPPPAREVVMPDRDLLVWFDMETTGLNPEKDVPLQIAMVVTDNDLVVWDTLDLTLQCDEFALYCMPEFVREMHTQSGLLDHVAKSDVSLEDASQKMVSMLQRWSKRPKSLVLVGNSIHFDRGFIRRYFPDVEAFLHYRMVDVSSFYEMFVRWFGIEGAYGRTATPHWAIKDLQRSIAELQYYRSKCSHVPSDESDGAGVKTSWRPA